jgi:hypothetical protein
VFAPDFVWSVLPTVGTHVAIPVDDFPAREWFLGL